MFWNLDGHKIESDDLKMLTKKRTITLTDNQEEMISEILEVWLDEIIKKEYKLAVEEKWNGGH